MEHFDTSSQLTNREFMRNFAPEQCDSVEDLRQAITVAENRLTEIQKAIRSDISHAKDDYQKTGKHDSYALMAEAEQKLNQEVQEIIDFIQDCDNQIIKILSQTE